MARGTTADRTGIRVVCSPCVICVLSISNLQREECILGDLLKLLNTTARQSPASFSQTVKRQGIFEAKKRDGNKNSPYKIGNALPFILLGVFYAVSLCKGTDLMLAI